MSAEGRLRGSCSCGRYNYVVHIPADEQARSQAHVHFGTRRIDHRSNASLLSAWLRIPLTWYQSATMSFFPDERHHHIARTFTPPDQPACQRKFCGFCGTHISYWTEEPPSEQDFMHITLGSLGARDLLALEDLDLLPKDVEGNTLTSAVPASSEQAVTTTTPGEDDMQRSVRRGTAGGISWFEEMMEGSQLGHLSKRRKGYGTSADGTTSVSWEISEYFGSDEAEEESTAAGSKRKAVEIETDDTDMKG